MLWCLISGTMLSEEDEEDMFTPIKLLIEGCEGFIKQKLAEAKQDIKLEVHSIKETLNYQAKGNHTDRKRIQELEKKESAHVKKLKVSEDKNEKGVRSRGSMVL